MSVTVAGRTLEGVTILDFAGRITLGEGSTRLRDTVKAMVGDGKKNLLLNLSEVTYIDSSGMGELVSAFMTVTNSGGNFKLLHLAERVERLLQHSKLYTVFEVFNNEVAAVRSFSGRDSLTSLHCRCPLCGFWSRPALVEGQGWLPQACAGCGSQFTVEPSPAGAPDTVVARKISAPTYWSEYFHLLCGSPFIIEVAGRLTMFSDAAIHKLWEVIPAPQKVLFDLSSVTEVERGGSDSLVKLLSGCQGNCRAAVSVEGVPANYAMKLPEHPSFFQKRSDALAALGDVSDTLPVLVSVGNF